MTGKQLGLFDQRPIPEPIYDIDAARELRDKGMTLAANNNRELLELAREVAITIAEHDPDGECDANRVGVVLTELYGVEEFGNWMGSVFKQKWWEFTGRRVQAKRKSRHGNEIRIWRLNSKTYSERNPK